MTYIFWVIVLFWLVMAPANFAGAEQTTKRTWKSVEELSQQELGAVRLDNASERHPEVEYFPAATYPFAPPFTAEEMGYRAMEFTPRARWSSVVANSWGSIASQGVLLNPGTSVTFVSYDPEYKGVRKILAAKPGEEIYRSLSQAIAPPAAEGGQWLAIRYRTDKDNITKEQRFRYSSSLRRVRSQAPLRRQSQFPNMALTPDDAWGRDAWEFSWRILGVDVLHETVRFPRTRPTIILRDGESGQFRSVATNSLKLMGEAFSGYTDTGGVECYVVEAKARPEWLPDYYAPRLIYWLEKRSFFPLRSEQYGRDGNLQFIEVRLAEHFNTALKDLGYGTFMITHWDVAGDIMSYLVNDSHKVLQWEPEEATVFFNPDFMRRQWYLDASIKSQAAVKHPSQYFLRPGLQEGKFPKERVFELAAEVAKRVRAQDAAGRLIFDGMTQDDVSQVTAQASRDSAG